MGTHTAPIPPDLSIHLPANSQSGLQWRREKEATTVLAGTISGPRFIALYSTRRGRLNPAQTLRTAEASRCRHLLEQRHHLRQTLCLGHALILGGLKSRCLLPNPIRHRDRGLRLHVFVREDDVTGRLVLMPPRGLPGNTTTFSANTTLRAAFQMERLLRGIENHGLHTRQCALDSNGGQRQFDLDYQLPGAR